MGKRILLVEDDVSFRGVIARALGKALASEQLAVSFVEAGTLAEARVRLKEGGLDAALIDVTMPDGDGLELVGEIHDGGVGSPITSFPLHPEAKAKTGSPLHWEVAGCATSSARL